MVDASAAVFALLHPGEARAQLDEEWSCSPHFVDSEIANVLRRQVRRGAVSSDDASEALRGWMRFGVERFPATDLLPRVWELRHNLTGYDATYVALAERLGCALLTGDRRMSRAPGPTCRMVLVAS